MLDNERMVRLGKTKKKVYEKKAKQRHPVLVNVYHATQTQL